jgi:hypothetical protein
MPELLMLRVELARVLDTRTITTNATDNSGDRISFGLPILNGTERGRVVQFAMCFSYFDLNVMARKPWPKLALTKSDQKNRTTNRDSGTVVLILVSPKLLWS